MTGRLTYFQEIEGWLDVSAKGYDLLTLRDIEGSALSVVTVITLDGQPHGSMNHVSLLSSARLTSLV